MKNEILRHSIPAGNPVLIDPFGWEGNTNDPLPHNPGTVMWQGYVKPQVDSVMIDTQSMTLKIAGTNLVQLLAQPSVEVWRRLEEITTGTNAKDGTKITNLTILVATANFISARVTQDIITNAESYAVKVGVQDGPRSKAVAPVVQ